MSDYNTKVYRKQDGDEIVVTSGGKITVENGGVIVLPTADPGVAGALWNNAGTIAVSAG